MSMGMYVDRETNITELICVSSDVSRDQVRVSKFVAIRMCYSGF